MKRILLTIIALLCTVASHADNSLWTYYQAYHQAEDVVCAGNLTYALFNGNLLCYDATDNSVQTFDKLTGLSDKDIQHIGYSASQQCVVLLYSDNNIDILTADNHVVNIPQMKQFSDYTITCNNLNVCDDWALVSTTEGVVLIDLQKSEIKGYYRIEQSVNDAVMLGNTLYAAFDGRLMQGNINDNLYDLSAWKLCDSHTISKLVKLRNMAYAIAPYSSSQADGGLFHIGEEADGARPFTRISTTWLDSGSALNDQAQFVGSSKLLIVTSDAPQEIKSTQIGFAARKVARASNGTYWMVGSSEGLHNYKLNSTEGTIAETDVRIEQFGPLTDNCYRLNYIGERLFVSGGRMPYYTTPTAMILDNGNWKFFQTEGLTLNDNSSFYAVSSIAEDPDDENHHFISFFGGLLEYRDMQFIKHYNASNSPIETILTNGTNYHDAQYALVDGLNYDSEGNLWMLNQRTDSVVKVLMKDGTWRKIYVEGLRNAMVPEKTLFDGNGRVWITSRSTSTVTAGLACVYLNGKLTTDGDLESVFRYSANNEDGTSTDFSQVRDLCFDRNGQLWIGSINGVFAITDPDTWSSSSFTIYQPKVPRNDGTNYADYLLTGIDVTAVAVDGGNRKWLGTLGSGIYLVNEDGSEVIEHFTESNTPLLSNNIYSIAIHPTSGEVMIGTDKGLCSYRSGVTQPESSLNKSNVKVYPNPVRPEYSGNVTIAGLTEGAEVKILSTAGQLIHRGNATGGSYLWDVTGSTGQRVSPGVYYIMIATADGKNSIAAKMVVI